MKIKIIITRKRRLNQCNIEIKPSYENKKSIPKEPRFEFRYLDAKPNTRSEPQTVATAVLISI